MDHQTKSQYCYLNGKQLDFFLAKKKATRQFPIKKRLLQTRILRKSRPLFTVILKFVPTKSITS